MKCFDMIKVVMILTGLCITVFADFEFAERVRLPESVLSIPGSDSYLFLHPTAVDWDGDGDEDLISGTKFVSEDWSDQRGTMILFENTGTQSSPVYEFRDKMTAGGTAINIEFS